MSPYTRHILDLRLLALAGYPFKKNDLSHEEWMDIGAVNDIFNRIRSRPAFAGR